MTELDELESRKSLILESIDSVAYNEGVLESVPGKKLLKRMERDLDAIRKKYSAIIGCNDSQLAELHRLQGRELQLDSDINSIRNSHDHMKLLNKELYEINSKIKEVEPLTLGR